jgi:hypothetical protein
MTRENSILGDVYETDWKRPVRYFYCGEYGERRGRPHYHALLFNCNFKDKQFLKISPTTGYPLYTSKALEYLWPYGFNLIGTLTPESAGYVARYAHKKLPKRQQKIKAGKPEEFSIPSRMPGLGYEYFKKYYKDFYPSDFLVMDKIKYRIPKYYDRQYEKINPEELSLLKEKRTEYAKEFSKVTPARLQAMEQEYTIRIAKLKRGLEDDGYYTYNS